MESKKYRWVCSECGSSNITVSANMSWDYPSQTWKANDLLDDDFCEDCETYRVMEQQFDTPPPLTRKQQAKLLYEDFMATPSKETAQQLLELKKVTKTSWYRLGIHEAKGQIIEAYVLPTPKKPRSSIQAPLIPNPPERTETLKERATTLYEAMCNIQNSAVAVDIARELMALKTVSRKNWSYLGIDNQMRKKIEITMEEF